jgi:glycosyltransferase involved in cell wall biosynthesis
MRIGLDAHILGKGKGGVERVVDQMVRWLPEHRPNDEFVVFVHKNYRPARSAPSNVRYRALPVSDPLLQRSIVLPWLARRENLDLLHVQRAAPPRVRAKLVVHTHDLLPLTAPQDHRGFRDRVVRQLTPLSLRKADCVLTVSESVAEEIRGLFPDVAPRVAAVLNGVEGGLFRPRTAGAPRSDIHARLGLEVKGPYLLYVGALMARKNLEVTLRAYGQFLSRMRAEGRPAPKLVLAGMSRSEDYARRLREMASEIAADEIVFAGFVTDSDCVSLLQHADAFVAPSRGEGFDLPALEAMACAIPVVCSDIPVHRELLADDALYFSVDRADAFAAQLCRLAADPGLRAELTRRGPRRAQRFCWESSMRGLAELYQQILGGRRTTLCRV